MGDGDVSVIITLICNTNTTLCAACPDSNDMEIIMPDGPPYTAGDVMTCTSNGYPDPTYSWTVDTTADSSTTNTQVLLEGTHDYECTATVTIQGTPCSDSVSVTTVTAYSKYQKH